MKNEKAKSTEVSVSEAELLSPAEAAKLKDVSRSAVYTAIHEGRLPHLLIGGRFVVKKGDVLAWTPVKYRERPGSKGGRPAGVVVSEETKRRMSEAQKRRWLAQREQK